MRGILTPAQAAEAVRRLRPGDAFTYHVGDLGYERSRKSPSTGKLTARASALNELATFMLAQATIGDVVIGDRYYGKGFGAGTLKQRRLAPLVTEYLFVRGEGKLGTLIEGSFSRPVLAPMAMPAASLSFRATDAAGNVLVFQDVLDFEEWALQNRGAIVSVETL